MPAPKLSDAEVLEVARNAVKRFGGRFPQGVTQEDALQEAVVVVLEWEPRWKPRIYPVAQKAFLCVKAWSVLKDKFGKMWKSEYRGKGKIKPGREVEGFLFDEGVIAQKTGEHQDVSIDVREAIAQLPEQQAAIMTLHLEGLTQTEIAKRLGVTQPYVSQLMAKSKRALRILLAESYDE